MKKLDSFESTDPATGEPFYRIALDNVAAVDHKLAAASDAFRDWRVRSFAARSALVKEFAAELRAERERLADLMTREVGKPVREALGEVDKSAWCFEHYAENAESYLAPVTLPSDAANSYVRHLPLGAILGILPWNAPFWLAARVAAPALMAGNVVLVKHDPHVPACAEALGELAAKVLPAAVLQMLFVDDGGAETALRNPRIRAVSLTGSSRAGRAVGAIAGNEIKPMVLELGGSDPAIVLADADLDAAVPAIALMRTIMGGQSCIAAKRIIVERGVYGEFNARLLERFKALKMGDPGKPETDIGPVARADLRENLHRQVRESVAAGAKCLLGGKIPEGPGFFYPPTLLIDVPADSPAFTEETFGPVAAVIPADDADHAVALANRSRYGLAASIWCETSRGEALAAQLETGQVAVNGLVKTDPRLPSGGVKESGIGRELGPHGILEFVNVQQVWIGPARKS